VERELQAIAALKVDQIASWRRDQLSEATVIMSSPFVVERVARWFHSPATELAEGVVAYFSNLMQRHHYHDVILLDETGKVRLSLAGHSEVCASVKAISAQVMRDLTPRLADLHVDAVSSEPHVVAVAPLLLMEGSARRSIGSILLVSVAAEFLYPLIQSWPTASDTAETLLVRRDGDSVLYLNELRHRANTALNLRMPLTQQELPAVMAVLGAQGVVRGRDYRGEEVVSVLRPIPDSPWFMVSKVDEDEVFSAWHARSLLLLALFVALLAMLVLVGVVSVQRGRLAHALALRASEQDREKLREQLVQAQKLESIGRLAGGVAHDFNNMLAVILGRCEIALESLTASHPVQRDLREIEAAAQRSAELTKQLLAFARKQIICPKVLSLNDTVSGMLTMLRRLIGEDVELEFIPGPLLSKVKMDPTSVDQILANLAINARDAITQGNGKITIETQNASLDESYVARHAGAQVGDRVMLAFSDNGYGMGKDVVEHLFEPFFTTKALGQGTGLGLATVYGIVQQNSGSIEVYSEPGLGTTFKLYFPTCEVDDTAVAGAATSEIPKGCGELILIVEDEEAILGMAKTMLERVGYRVLAESSPGKAMELLAESDAKVKLLLTDVVMPQYNGRQIAEILKQTEPDLRVLYMSGYTTNVIAHHGVLEDGVAFIQKPFTLRELATKVRGVLDS
jgi:signal transduction histidine kinase/CheY-like chemotaxis protein